MYWILGMSAGMVGSVISYIVVHAINNTAVDWNGLGVFLGAISVFIGTGLGAKVWQKQYENKKDVGQE